MCVRIRMNFGNGGEDDTQRAWELNRVGIWYGSWRPQDLYDAYGNERPIVAANVAATLNQTLAAREGKALSPHISCLHVHSATASVQELRPSALRSELAYRALRV